MLLVSNGLCACGELAGEPGGAESAAVHGRQWRSWPLGGIPRRTAAAWWPRCRCACVLGKGLDKVMLWGCLFDLGQCGWLKSQCSLLWYQSLESKEGGRVEL